MKKLFIYAPSLSYACLLMVVTAWNAAHADPIGVTIEGTISTHFGDTWIQPGFSAGSHFVGHYIFESTTPGNKFATNFGGIPPQRTPYPGALLSFTATSVANTLTSSGSTQNGILIDDNLNNRDDYFVVLSSPESELYIDLRSSNAGLFTSQSLPLTVPPVTSFNVSAFFRIATLGASGGFAYAQGNLDSIVVTPVPEPSTWVLLGGGALLVSFRRKLL